MGNKDRNQETEMDTKIHTKHEIGYKEEGMHAKNGCLIAILGTILVVGGFLVLVCAAIMQENGIRVSTPITLAGFFGCNIAGIFLFYKAYPHLMIADYIQMNKKYDCLALSELEGMDRDRLRERLLKSGFAHTEEDYYIKKEFSALREHTYYYVRIVDDNELEHAIMQEVDYFNTTKKTGKHFCLLVFVYMDCIGEKEKKDIKEFEKGCIFLETVRNPQTEISIIAVGVDSATQKGYYLDIDQANMITLYAHSCKLLRSI